MPVRRITPRGCNTRRSLPARLARTLFRCAVVLVLLPQAPLHARQARDTTEASDLTALRRSLDQIVVLLQRLVDQSSRRDSATLMLSRIELAERHLAPVEQDLRALRQRREAETAEQAKLQASFRSIDDMQRLDVTGSAREAFEAERQRVSTSVAQKESAIAEIDRQIATVEADIARRREAITKMEAQFDQLARTP